MSLQTRNTFHPLSSLGQLNISSSSSSPHLFGENYWKVNLYQTKVGLLHADWPAGELKGLKFHPVNYTLTICPECMPLSWNPFLTTSPNIPSYSSYSPLFSMTLSLHNWSVEIIIVLPHVLNISLSECHPNADEITLSRPLRKYVKPSAPQAQSTTAPSVVNNRHNNLDWPQFEAYLLTVLNYTWFDHWSLCDGLLLQRCLMLLFEGTVSQNYNYWNEFAELMSLNNNWNESDLSS